MTEKLKKFIDECEIKLDKPFSRLDAICLHNQKKVLDAFRKNSVALRHFSGTTGYGYDDAGRLMLNKVYADVFHTEDALVGCNIASGTHAITLTLFGLLRPNDLMLSISGEVYDTLKGVIKGKDNGSLADFGIDFSAVPLTSEFDFDEDSIKKALIEGKPKIIYIQRSRGYEWRNSLTCAQIENAINFIRQIKKDSIIVVDNCYGEFVESVEPTDVGADIVVGSLIKNTGGGFAPCGGYVAGKKLYIDLIANRLTAPSLGAEIGSSERGYRDYYQGLFVAPHTVKQALKTALLFSCAYSSLGYSTLPDIDGILGDIVCSIKLNNEKELIELCQAIQSASPIESFARPQPWDMPGYKNKVIMAAGCFVQGASIELSCDAPLREPYIAYLQGSLTYEHGKIALMEALSKKGQF